MFKIDMYSGEGVISSEVWYGLEICCAESWAEFMADKLEEKYNEVEYKITLN